jgi:NAD(P)-dependent dehydrogenase (short-subunit alcohol dehydrogenase family)
MSLPAPGPDRTAVVTGASSGIGAEIARDLAGLANRVGAAVSQVAPRSVLLPILARSHPGLRE